VTPVTGQNRDSGPASAAAGHEGGHLDPSEVEDGRHWFDECAELARNVASRSSFFMVLVVGTIVWAVAYPVFGSVSAWHAAFVLPAEIITLLLVALLENSSRRSEQALHRKLDAFAAVLADMAAESSSSDVSRHADELRAAIGLQDREATDNG
jgi:low affinity Fe/Cu permease